MDPNLCKECRLFILALHLRFKHGRGDAQDNRVHEARVNVDGDHNLVELTRCHVQQQAKYVLASLHHKLNLEADGAKQRVRDAPTTAGWAVPPYSCPLLFPPPTCFQALVKAFCVRT